jgi:hypothetical protein
MTSEEARTFLGGRAHALLVTLSPDGAPDASLVDCRRDGDALIISDVVDRANEAIARDPRVAVSVEQCPSYYEIRGATAHGTLELGNQGEYRLALDDVVAFDFAKIQRRI